MAATGTGALNARAGEFANMAGARMLAGNVTQLKRPRRYLRVLLQFISVFPLLLNSHHPLLPREHVHFLLSLFFVSRMFKSSASSVDESAHCARQ
jgi:hypothetical protein